MFVVITVAGALTLVEGDAGRDEVNAEVGDPGMAMVALRAAPWMYGFVNDCGLICDPPMKRNPVGACVLASFGASPGIYAGPVVITGWDPSYDAETEICDLSPWSLAALVKVHRSVGVALGGVEVSELGAGWDAATRGYAERVRHAPFEGIRFVTGDDALEVLMGRLT
jgi:hypothetical protein